MKLSVLVATSMAAVVCLAGLTIAASVSKTTVAPKTDTNCTQYSGSCDDCLGSSTGKCVYCNHEKDCRAILNKGFFNAGEVCEGGLMDASWLTCSVNMLALVIGMGVVGGVLLISICTCICCCCCCKNSAKQKLKWMRQDAATDRKTDERKAKYAERRAERQVKNDEIRKKYGLFKGGQSSYQKMEDNDA